MGEDTNKEKELDEVLSLISGEIASEADAIKSYLEDEKVIGINNSLSNHSI
jgi:hypothetical protein